MSALRDTAADLFKAASRSPNYVRRFGLPHGLRLLGQIERGRGESPRIRRYRVPGFAAPIYLRDSLADHSMFWQCLVRCQYDFRRFPQSERLFARYRESVRRGTRPLIIDCGGNIGLATVWLATQFPDARVCTIEPERKNLEVLAMNVQSFGDRVTVLEGGVWGEKGELRIANPEAGSASFRVVTGSHANDSIRAYTIDEICLMAGAEAPFIVKIDIEGAQASLFRSNTDWVGRAHLISLELDDWLLPWQGTSRNFFACISRYPFDYLLGGENLICFRDVEAMQDSGASVRGTALVTGSA